MAGWAAAAQGISDIGATTANAVLAAQTRKWMEHMRDTQYQATVKDLRKANLNPSLAFGGGPSVAGVGTPPTASVESPDIQGGFQKYLASSKQSKAMEDELKQIRFGGEKAEADASTAWSQAENASGLLASEKRLNMSIADKNFEDAKKAVSEQLWVGQQERESQARTKLLKTELPRAEADMRFYESDTGQKVRTAERLLEVFPLLRGAFQTRARR